LKPDAQAKENATDPSLADMQPTQARVEGGAGVRFTRRETRESRFAETRTERENRVNLLDGGILANSGMENVSTFVPPSATRFDVQSLADPENMWASSCWTASPADHAGKLAPHRRGRNQKCG
jgi:hypothetical protein